MDTADRHCGGRNVLQVVTITKPVKPLTLADVRPGERFKWCDWYRRLASNFNTAAIDDDNKMMACVNERSNIVTLLYPNADIPVEIDGRTAEPAKPATVPVGDLKPGDVFEYDGRLFSRTASRENDRKYNHANSMPLECYLDGYTFPMDYPVTPCPDAVLIITR